MITNKELRDEAGRLLAERDHLWDELGGLLDALHDDIALRLGIYRNGSTLAHVQSAASVLGGPYLIFAKSWL